MRYRRHVRWIAALGAVVALAACSADPTPTATPASEPTATPAPPSTPEATPTPALPAGAVGVSLGASQDATLINDPGAPRANGAGEYLFVGVTGQPQVRRTLIAFDVAGGIPADATVLSAELTLDMSRTSNPFFANVMALHRVTASWGEGASDPLLNEGRGDDALPGDATWAHRTFDDQEWATPGGDFVSSASATAEVVRLGSYTWGSTDAMVADVQAWLDDPDSSYGWAIVGDEVESRGVKRFDSRENTDETARPVLTVVYVPAGS